MVGRMDTGAAKLVSFMLSQLDVSDGSVSSSSSSAADDTFPTPGRDELEQKTKV
jgi:hypothetical protein